ncbi:hypothetical protein U1Q18_010248, partial [Sarracenia purpurea var. burkii]
MLQPDQKHTDQGTGQPSEGAKQKKVTSVKYTSDDVSGLLIVGNLDHKRGDGNYGNKIGVCKGVAG